MCRSQLVPQPEHHPMPPSGSRPPGGGRSPGGGGADGGLFQSFFNSVASSNPRTGRSSNPSNGQSDGEHHVPGGWDDELD